MKLRINIEESTFHSFEINTDDYAMPEDLNTNEKLIFFTAELINKIKADPLSFMTELNEEEITSDSEVKNTSITPIEKSESF